MGERIGQAEGGGPGVAVGAGTEEPQLGFARAVGKGSRIPGEEAAPSPGSRRSTRSRGPAHPEVDAAGAEGVEHPGRLGHLERAVVGQEDPTGADPDGRGGIRHRAWVVASGAELTGDAPSQRAPGGDVRQAGGRNL